MELQKQMLELILKDLPNQTAGVLKDYLKDADQLKKRIEILEETAKASLQTLQNKDAEISKLRIHIEALSCKIKAQDVLDAQVKFNKEALDRLDITLAQRENESLRRENQAIMELTRVVFRNPRFVNTEQKSVPIAVENTPQYGQTGNSGQHVEYHNEVKTTTTEQE